MNEELGKTIGTLSLMVMNVVQLVLIILKILGIQGIIDFDCPWWFVFLPLEAEGALLALIIISIAIAYIVGLCKKD